MVQAGRSMLARKAAEAAVEEFKREFHETPLTHGVLLHRPNHSYKTLHELLDDFSPKVQ